MNELLTPHNRSNPREAFGEYFYTLRFSHKHSDGAFTSIDNDSIRSRAHPLPFIADCNRSHYYSAATNHNATDPVDASLAEPPPRGAKSTEKSSKELSSLPYTLLKLTDLKSFSLTSSPEQQQCDGKARPEDDTTDTFVLSADSEFLHSTSPNQFAFKHRPRPGIAPGRKRVSSVKSLAHSQPVPHDRINLGKLMVKLASSGTESVRSRESSRKSKHFSLISRSIGKTTDNSTREHAPVQPHVMVSLGRGGASRAKELEPRGSSTNGTTASIESFRSTVVEDYQCTTDGEKTVVEPVKIRPIVRNDVQRVEHIVEEPVPVQLVVNVVDQSTNYEATESARSGSGKPLVQNDDNNDVAVDLIVENRGRLPRAPVKFDQETNRSLKSLSQRRPTTFPNQDFPIAELIREKSRDTKRRKKVGSVKNVRARSKKSRKIFSTRGPSKRSNKSVKKLDGSREKRRGRSKAKSPAGHKESAPKIKPGMFLVRPVNSTAALKKRSQNSKLRGNKKRPRSANSSNYRVRITSVSDRLLLKVTSNSCSVPRNHSVSWRPSRSKDTISTRQYVSRPKQWPISDNRRQTRFRSRTNNGIHRGKIGSVSNGVLNQRNNNNTKNRNKNSSSQRGKKRRVNLVDFFAYVSVIPSEIDELLQPFRASNELRRLTRDILKLVYRLESMLNKPGPVKGSKSSGKKSASVRVSNDDRTDTVEQLEEELDDELEDEIEDEDKRFEPPKLIMRRLESQLEDAYEKETDNTVKVDASSSNTGRLGHPSQEDSVYQRPEIRMRDQARVERRPKRVKTSINLGELAVPWGASDFTRVRFWSLILRKVDDGRLEDQLRQLGRIKDRRIYAIEQQCRCLFRLDETRLYSVHGLPCMQLQFIAPDANDLQKAIGTLEAKLPTVYQQLIFLERFYPRRGLGSPSRYPTTSGFVFGNANSRRAVVNFQAVGTRTVPVIERALGRQWRSPKRKEASGAGGDAPFGRSGRNAPTDEPKRVRFQRGHEEAVKQLRAQARPGVRISPRHNV